LCALSAGAQNAPERHGVKNRLHGFEQCKFRVVVMMFGGIAAAEGRHPRRKDRCKIFSHFGPVEQQGREALLVYLVDDDAAYCP
jgi:hypothetical protein